MMVTACAGTVPAPQTASSAAPHATGGTAATSPAPPSSTTTAATIPPAPTTTMPQLTSTTAATTTTTTIAEPVPPSEVTPFTDEAAVAAILAEAEAALADAATPAGHRARWAWAQQQAYRDLVDNPEWQAAARAAVPEELQAAFDLNIVAGTALRELTTPRPALPGWDIVAPPPVAELRAHYDDAEGELGVPWSVLAAIHLVETRFGRIRGDSHAGARGPMQFLPATWDAYGEGDIEDPADAIAAAARYLVAHGAPGNMRRALYAYNHSDLYVDAVLAHAEAMDLFPHYLEAYHGWRVYYRLETGDVVLGEG